MKIFFLFAFSFLILCSNSSLAKEFKSANGYSFETPKKHRVIELDIKKAMSNVEDSDNSNSLDKEMLKETLEVNIRYITYIVLKNEKKPDQFNINITASSDILMQPYDFEKSWCPEFEAYFDAMVINKKINMYECRKDNLSINNKDEVVLKFVYDTMFPATFMYHYMFLLNNHMINVAGTCLEENCSNIDKTLKDISTSFRWN